MTRKRCKELLPIMQAFAEGKEIQFKDKTSEEWVNLVNDDSTFCINDWCEYRIKPTEEYRPYKDCDEMFRTKQVVTKDSAEVIKLRNQVFIARGLLEKWHNQHSDKGYTKTFYDELIKATEEFLWSDV